MRKVCTGRNRKLFMVSKRSKSEKGTYISAVTYCCVTFSCLLHIRVLCCHTHNSFSSLVFNSVIESNILRTSTREMSNEGTREIWHSSEGSSQKKMDLYQTIEEHEVFRTVAKAIPKHMKHQWTQSEAQDDDYKIPIMTMRALLSGRGFLEKISCLG